MKKRHFDRTERVADLIQKELSNIILHEMSDSGIGMVTITGVTVSRDLSYAKVYVSVLLDEAEQVKQTIQALNRSAKGLRYHLAKVVDLRVMPELKFVFDEATAHGFHISNLIDSAINKEKK